METSKSNTPTPRKRRKRLSLFLLNDDHHSFQYVNNVLGAILPMCNSLQAEQIATIVHGTGECQIYSGFAPEIYMIYAKFRESGLVIDLREHTKTNRK